MSDFLPNEWLQVKLENCVEILDAQRIPINNDERQSRVENKQIEDLFPYYGATGQVGWIDDFIFNDELIALGEDGVPFFDPMKTKAYKLIGKTWVNNHAHVLKAIKEITFTNYLLNYLNFFDYHGFVNGGTRLKLTQANMRKIPVPLPPKAEQEKIAELLDSHLAQVETIKTRLNAIFPIFKKFRQSVLADAVSGRLTEDWRLGNKIDFDWKNLTINDISTVRTGKTPSRKEEKYWENGSIPWVTSSATGFEFCYSTEEKISQIASEECNLKPFPKGSLVLAMYGEGKTRGQVTELMIEATCNQACAVIIVNNEIALTRFIKLRLKENYEHTRKLAVGGNQPNLNLNKVREIEISLPPLEEQNEIVERVEQLFAYADTIEIQLTHALQRVNQLTQSILHQAFTGKLTAHWRTQNPHLITGDNSATALLAQIQTAKQKATPTKKTKKVKNAD